MAEHGSDVGIFNFQNAVPHQGIPVSKVRIRNVTMVDVKVAIMPKRKLTLQALFEEECPGKFSRFLQDLLVPHSAVDKYFQLKNNSFYELFDTNWYTKWNSNYMTGFNLSNDEFDDCVRDGLDTIAKLELSYANSLNFIHCVTENLYHTPLPSLISSQKELHSFMLQPNEVTTLTVLVIGSQLCVLHTPEIDFDPMTTELNLYESDSTNESTEFFVQKNKITNSGCAIFMEDNNLFICAFFSGELYNKLDLNFLKSIANPEPVYQEDRQMRILIEEHIDTVLGQYDFDRSRESPIMYDEENNVDMISVTSSEIRDDFKLPDNDDRELDFSLLEDDQCEDAPHNTTQENQGPEFLSVAFTREDFHLLQPNNITSEPDETFNRSAYIESLIREQEKEQEHEKLEYWTLHSKLNTSGEEPTIPTKPGIYSSELDISNWINDEVIPLLDMESQQNPSNINFEADLTSEDIIQLINQASQHPVNAEENIRLQNIMQELLDLEKLVNCTSEQTENELDFLMEFLPI